MLKIPNTVPKLVPKCGLCRKHEPARPGRGLAWRGVCGYVGDDGDVDAGENHEDEDGDIEEILFSMRL